VNEEDLTHWGALVSKTNKQSIIYIGTKLMHITKVEALQNI